MRPKRRQIKTDRLQIISTKELLLFKREIDLFILDAVEHFSKISRGESMLSRYRATFDWEVAHQWFLTFLIGQVILDV